MKIMEKMNTENIDFWEKKKKKLFSITVCGMELY